jgi:tetratricopeptide (TPR) repeat protein
LSKYHSKKIFENYKNNDKEKLLNYHIKTRSQYLVFGYCDKRLHKGEKHYFIKLDASVYHKEIKKDISQAFSGDMRKALPNKLYFPETEEIVGFQITGNIIGLGARYIIGRASFYSKDFQTAFELHKNLLEEINNIRSKLGKQNIDKIDLPVIDKIEELSKKNLIITALILAWINYLHKKNYDEMYRFIEEVQLLEPNNYDSLLLKSVYFFLKNRDINSAMEELKKAENNSNSDSTWLYNKAFLLAYKGKLNDAYHTYKRAFGGKVVLDIPLVVEEFIYNIWEEEIEKIQLLYCLGLINFFYKKDYILAKKYFKEFVELAEKKHIFLEQINYSKNYLAKMS